MAWSPEQTGLLKATAVLWTLTMVGGRYLVFFNSHRPNHQFVIVFYGKGMSVFRKCFKFCHLKKMFIKSSDNLKDT